MGFGLHIKNIKRTTSAGEPEEINFDSGVNLLIGGPNSGKTVWLMMLDFLFGDTGSVEQALDRDDRDGTFLYDIYKEISAIVEINDEEYLIERKWKEKGLKSKTIIDGQSYDPSEFSKFILDKLSIPSIKFPKGNPYQDGAWIELTFRILFRHIYRQERFWTDLADKQPESEQHAALCQFLGLAQHLFSPMSNELVERRKELQKLQAQKDQFQDVLDQITKRLLPAGEKSIVFVTADILKERIQELKNNMDNLLNERQQVINKGVSATLDKNKESVVIEIALTEDRAKIVADLQENQQTRKQAEERQYRFKALLKTIESELGKLSRAKTAGDLLADIKITHCPACDQAVHPQENDDDTCFLCHQHLNLDESEKRVDFELDQLESERKELVEMLNRIQSELIEQIRLSNVLKDRLIIIDQQLLPLKQKLSGLVQNQVSSLDLQRGKLQEQIQNYTRILHTLNYRDELSKKIDGLSLAIAEQTKELPEALDLIEFEQVADDLTDGMMEYINEISKDNPDRWFFSEGKSRIRLYLNDKRFDFRIGRTNWSSNGLKPKTYFLLAYHYGLLKLFSNTNYNYPGLLILDFPPVLADGALSTSENYLIKPFIKLSENLNNSIQVIIAGEAFGELENVHTIALEGAYK